MNLNPTAPLRSRMRAAYDYDDADLDAAFPGRSDLKGLKQIKFDFVFLTMLV